MAKSRVQLPIMFELVGIFLCVCVGSNEQFGENNMTSTQNEFDSTPCPLCTCYQLTNDYAHLVIEVARSGFWPFSEWLFRNDLSKCHALNPQARNGKGSSGSCQ